MKSVKLFIAFVIILLCFALNSELYQSQLQYFSNQYYFIEIENEDGGSVCSLVKAASEQYNEKHSASKGKALMRSAPK